MRKRFFDPDTLDGKDCYKLISGLVVPRPIGWIGTRRQDGTFNLAPFSFFNVIAADPPTVLFSGGRHGPDRPKDSVALAEETGEFTVNIVSEEVAEAMSLTSAALDPGEDEFLIAGLTPVVGEKVSAPMVAESPASLECRVVQVLEIGTKTKAVIGGVVGFHIREDVLDGTRINNDLLGAIGRMAGTTYIHTRDRFDLEHP